MVIIKDGVVDEHIMGMLFKEPKNFKMFSIEDQQLILNETFNLTKYKVTQLDCIAQWFEVADDKNIFLDVLGSLINLNKFTNYDIKQHQEFNQFCLSHIQDIVKNTRQGYYFFLRFQSVIKKQQLNYLLKHIISIYENDIDMLNNLITAINHTNLPVSKQIMKQIEFIKNIL